MNLHDQRYYNFALVREMLETPRIVGGFDFQAARDAAQPSAKPADCFSPARAPAAFSRPRT